VNVPPSVGAAISADKSLALPLSQAMGLEDLYDVLEVLQVDAHNRRVIARREEE
jgi:hypothetical protein